MEQLEAIASQLGINGTIFHQFIIVVIMFFFTRHVFYNVLQKVLDERVKNTTKLDGEADHLIEKAENLQSEFDSKLKEANQKSMETLSLKKGEISKKFDADFKKEEERVNKEVDEKIKQVSEEITANKAKVLSESKSLAESLVNKLV